MSPFASKPSAITNPDISDTGRIAPWLRWTERFLIVLTVLAIALAIAIWASIFTSRCEGFGCIGLGVVTAAALGIELFAIASTGLLIWLRRRRDLTTPIGWVLLLGVGVHIGYYILRGILR